MLSDSEKKIILYGAFGAAAAIRLLLFTLFPALPELLAGRVEVSTPVAGFKRCASLMRWDEWDEVADKY